MAIVVENSDWWAAAGSGILSEDFNCPSNTDALIAIITQYKATTDAHLDDLYPTTVTYDGQSFTVARWDEHTSTNRNWHIWIAYIANPSTGTNTFYFEPSEYTYHLATVLALSGVYTSDVDGANDGDVYSSSTTASDPIVTSYDDSLIVVTASCGHSDAVPNLTEITNTTEVGYYRWTSQNYMPALASGYRLAGSAGSYTVGWDSDTTECVNLVGEVEIRRTPVNPNRVKIRFLGTGTQLGARLGM